MNPKFVLLAICLSINGVLCTSGQSKIYFPLGSSCVAPAGCLMGMVWMCPPCYTGIKPTPSTGNGGAPADIAAQRQAALANGNSYRALHGAAPLTQDEGLEADAQRYAEKLCTITPMQHDLSIMGTQGENLAQIPSTQPSTIARANELWYSTEVNNYCPGGAPLGTSNGHFTQMVWKSSTKVGYGSAVCPNGNTYVVARYSPPGNVIGLQGTNVQC